MTRQPQRTEKHPFSAEARLDQIAGYILLGGSVASCILIATGLIALTRQSASSSIVGQPIASALHSAFALQPAGIINLGVLILLATPLLRVITAVVGFALLRWWRFTLISVTVLALLLVSLFVAS